MDGEEQNSGDERENHQTEKRRCEKISWSKAEENKQGRIEESRCTGEDKVEQKTRLRGKREQR